MSTSRGIDLVELGPAVMKGLPEPIELYRAERTTQPVATTVNGKA